MTVQDAALPPIDIRPEHWEIVRRILEKHVPDKEIWGFGSRATRKAREYSDLDLAIISKEPLPFSVLGALAEDFSDSDLPWKVDVLDWATTSEAFRTIIARDQVTLRVASSA
jgi:type I restriction enzyme S subunit